MVDDEPDDFNGTMGDNLGVDGFAIDIPGSDSGEVDATDNDQQYGDAEFPPSPVDAPYDGPPPSPDEDGSSADNWDDGFNDNGTATDDPMEPSPPDDTTEVGNWAEQDNQESRKGDNSEDFEIDLDNLDGLLDDMD